LALSKTERRYVTTTDGKKMLVWVILPTHAAKTQPFILPRRPQAALTQFYSFRFPNLWLQTDIIVALNRRGMPGQGEME
jgi:hypothetical protein